MPREGHDKLRYCFWAGRRYFNPRAPRGARRCITAKRLQKACNFNPRAPRGARHMANCETCKKVQFQSTCPARGTTWSGCPVCKGDYISIHVPREGHDFCGGVKKYSQCNFNPRAPRGARRRESPADYRRRRISIHVPREGHDAQQRQAGDGQRHFNPRAPRGARHSGLGGCVLGQGFQSTCPARGTTIYLFANGGSVTFQSTCPARGTTCKIILWIQTVIRFQSTCPARGTTHLF